MAKDTKLTVSLILNDAGFQKQLAAVNRELKLNESEFKKVSSTTENFSKTLEGANAKFESLTSQLESQTKKVNLYKSEIDKTKTTLIELTKKHGEQEDKLASLNQQYEEACETMGENSEEAKSLKKEIDELEKSKSKLENKIISTSARLDTLNTSLNNAETEFNELKRDVDNASNSLENFQTDEGKRRLEELSKSIDEAGDKFEKVGDKISKVGDTLTKKVTVPLTAIGTGALAVSMNFETSMSNVQAISGATGEDFDKLAEKAREMGAKTSKSAAESADALGYMALAGWDTQQMLEGLEPILRLSEAGAMDLALASDLVTDSMGTLKLSTKELPRYLDQVAKTSATSNTNIQQLMEALLNAGSISTVLNIPLEETNALLGVLANNGTKGYEAGTKLNSMLTRITSQSKPAIEAWDSIGVSVFDSEGKFRGMTTILKETKEKLKDLTEEEQMYFLKKTVGTDSLAQFTQLLDASGGELEELTAKIKDSDGAMTDMALTMQDNVKGQLTQLKSKLEEAGIKLGETLLPMLSKVVDKISELVDKFNELSPETQESIVKFGLMAAATGPVVKGIGGITKAAGGFIKTGSTLVSLLSKSAGAATAAGAASTAAAGTAAAGAGTGLAGLGAALGTVATAALPWVAAGAAVAGTGYLIHKELSEETIPTVDLFADKVEKTADAVYNSNGVMVKAAQYTTTAISEETQKAVGAYIALDDEVRNTLTGLYVNSIPITEQIATSISSKFSEMGTMIKTTLAQDSEESINTLSTFFENSTVMTAEYEQQILEQQAAHYQEKQEKIQGYEDRINSIIQGALNQGRELRQDELDAITRFEDQMREMCIESRSKTEEEASLILGRLASYDERITAEMASKHIQEAERMRIEAVDAATKEYNDRIAQIEYMRDESKVISEEQANKLIDEAERQRKETVKKAKDMKSEVVKKITTMNKDIADDVDTQTGKILTKWDKVKNWWNNWWPSKKTMQVDTVETRTVSTKYNTGHQNSPMVKSIEPLMAIDNFTDNLEVPNARSYAAETVKSMSVISNSRNATNEDLLTVLSSALQESVKQNEILNQVVRLLTNEKDVNVALQVDGRQIAKATAQYMSKEIDNINMRKNRLGGVF